MLKVEMDSMWVGSAGLRSRKHCDWLVICYFLLDRVNESVD